MGGDNEAYVKKGAFQHTMKSARVEGNDSLWSFEVDMIGMGDWVYMPGKAIISTSQMYISLEEQFQYWIMSQFYSLCNDEYC